MSKQLSFFDALDDKFSWLRSDAAAIGACASEMGRRGGIESGKVRRKKAKEKEG